MNRRIFEIIDKLVEPEHHWTWYQLNGKSPMENLAMQKKQWNREFMARELNQLLLEEEAKRSEEIANIELTIKSEVR